MIQGAYTVPVPPPKTNHSSVSIDAQAWVLGDRLQAIEFTSHAMGRLYALHVSDSKPFTPSDVAYVFSKSAPESKLRFFYKHLLAACISRPERAQGGPGQWLALLKQHDQLGMFVMATIQNGAQTKPLIHTLDYYMDGKEAVSEKDAREKGCSAVVPAKRKADEVGGKDEAGM